MKPFRIRAIALALPAVLGVASVLAGCASTPQATQSEQAASAAPFEHIHALTVDGRTGGLVAATHEGIYDVEVASNGDAAFIGPRAGLDFDPMGFVVSGDITYASGHPGPTTPASFGSPNLGLIRSLDRGMTWTNISLTGRTDFHALTVGPPASEGAPGTIFGLDSGKAAIQRSFDGGVTWTDGAEIAARDILADAALPGQLYATTEAGLATSTDYAASFQVDPTAPGLYLIGIDAVKEQLVGVDTGGHLWRYTDSTWVRGGAVTGVVEAFTSNNGRIYVSDDRGLAMTEDDGSTWKVLTVER